MGAGVGVDALRRRGGGDRGFRDEDWAGITADGKRVDACNGEWQCWCIEVRSEMVESWIYTSLPYFLLCNVTRRNNSVGDTVELDMI